MVGVSEDEDEGENMPPRKETGMPSPKKPKVEKGGERRYIQQTLFGVPVAVKNAPAPAEDEHTTQQQIEQGKKFQENIFTPEREIESPGSGGDGKTETLQSVHLEQAAQEVIEKVKDDVKSAWGDIAVKVKGKGSAEWDDEKYNPELSPESLWKHPKDSSTVL